MVVRNNEVINVFIQEQEVSQLITWWANGHYSSWLLNFIFHLKARSVNMLFTLWKFGGFMHLLLVNFYIVNYLLPTNQLDAAIWIAPTADRLWKIKRKVFLFFPSQFLCIWIYWVCRHHFYVSFFFDRLLEINLPASYEYYSTITQIQLSNW